LVYIKSQKKRRDSPNNASNKNPNNNLNRNRKRSRKSTIIILAITTIGLATYSIWKLNSVESVGFLSKEYFG
jgi:hypothetical protein